MIVGHTEIIDGLRLRSSVMGAAILPTAAWLCHSTWSQDSWRRSYPYEDETLRRSGDTNSCHDVSRRSVRQSSRAKLTASSTIFYDSTWGAPDHIVYEESFASSHRRPQRQACSCTCLQARSERSVGTRNIF